LISKAGAAAMPAALRWAAFALLAVVAACAPVYEPAFRTEMPRPLDAAARHCLTLCDQARDACFVPAREEFAQCSERAILAQDQCRSNAQIDYQICQRAYGPDGATCAPGICERERCPAPALDLCEADYRRCFAACGGTVVEERRCVANCPS
jgi:hypothetical protein